MSSVFIPTNPNDKHLTEIEQQKWEADLENKKYDFPYIALTKAQMKLLKQAQKDVVLVTPENENDVAVLLHHNFVHVLVKNEKRGIILRQRGYNFLAYAKKETAKERSITARDCFVAITGAICGFLLNCLLSG